MSTGLGKLSAGDTLYLRDGTYQPTSQTTFATNGTSSNRITISGYPGETAIIDGQDTYPGNKDQQMLRITGSYVTVTNIKIINAAAWFIGLIGDYGIFSNSICDEAWGTGVEVVGDYCTVDNVEVSGNGNHYGIDGQTTWGGALATQGDYTTIQNCLVHDNRGEGINIHKSCTGAIVQDNISYNNQALNLYLQGVTNATVRRNVVYSTAEGDASTGISIANEGGIYPEPSGHVICNNLVIGCWLSFNIAGDCSTVTDCTIAYNTFANTYKTAEDISGGYRMNVYLRNASMVYSNVVFKNNIVFESEQYSEQVPITVLATDTSGLTFSYNNWYETPVAKAQGTGDVIGDPKLTGGSYGAGTLTSNYFKIQSDSPCIDAGNPITGITTDYFGITRPSGTQVDMGAHEYNFEDLPIAMIRLT